MTTVASPRISNDLMTIGSLPKALNRDERLFGFVANNQDLSDAKYKAVSIAEARLTKLVAQGADLEKLSLVDTVINNSDLTAANCAEA